ncbi:MAG TPA: TonB-dependent receptor [Candidatus Kapabacteria bacterium]|nr:TonB-dependent receptor [Candidatus Kapabacteria bacterium]
MVLILFLLFLAVPASGQTPDSLVATPQIVDITRVAVRGVVLDAANEQPLIGARVAIPELKIGDVTNAKGEFEITNATRGIFTLRTTMGGYNDRETTVRIFGDTTIRVAMLTKTVVGKDVVVESTRERQLEERSVSRVTVTPETLDRIPAVGGEKDLFRVLQLMPGIKSLSEISSGLYIRGGSPDQNLIRLDGAVIYNPSHMFGFFSTFNTDAISGIELYKGGYPAEFGGRLTSVLNVSTKEANLDSIAGQTSISVISAKQTLEIPFYDGSFLVSGRRTYIDAFLNLIGAESLLDSGQRLPQYYFYDVNAKLTQNFGEWDKMSLSTYFGRDVLGYPQQRGTSINLAWGNTMAAANWTHIFNEKLFSNATASYTRYQTGSFGNFTNSGFEFDNGVKEYSGQFSFDYKPDPSNNFEWGGGVSRFEFTFFNSVGTTNEPLKDTSGVPFYFNAFAQHDWRLTDRWQILYGVRAEWMQLSDVVTIDPRITASYKFLPDWSVKLSAGVYHQYFHLASLGEFSFFDLWIPAVSPLPPSRSDQYILGISGYPMEGYYTSIETYYKLLTNIVDYNETKFLSNDINEIFPRGSGKAYGVELFFEKREGPLTGWIGYTLAWVKHRFDELNKGMEFSPKYDQRHDVQLVANYKINDRWEIGATWVYATGQAYTSALGYYDVGLDEIEQYADMTVPGSRGNRRLPAYHRMDASASYSFKMFGYPAKASLQIFNVYNHRNVWFRSVDADERPPIVEDILLLPILPTLGIEVSY